MHVPCFSTSSRVAIIFSKCSEEDSESLFISIFSVPNTSNFLSPSIFKHVPISMKPIKLCSKFLKKPLRPFYFIPRVVSNLPCCPSCTKQPITNPRPLFPLHCSYKFFFLFALFVVCLVQQIVKTIHSILLIYLLTV